VVSRLFELLIFYLNLKTSTHINQKNHALNGCNIHKEPIYLIYKINQFSYAKFSAKKINIRQNFKL
jgi:hypothetical protein